jgi:hypothetical protein
MAFPYLLKNGAKCLACLDHTYGGNRLQEKKRPLPFAKQLAALYAGPEEGQATEGVKTAGRFSRPRMFRIPRMSGFLGVSRRIGNLRTRAKPIEEGRTFPG